MRCVVARIHTELQHMLVARELALGTKLSRRVPDRGMEPVDRATHLRDDLHEKIIAAHMSELVEKNHAPPLATPFVCIRWKQHDRFEKSPSSRHRRGIAAKNSHVSRYAEPATDLISQIDPVLRLERVRAGSEATKREHSAGDCYQSGANAADPEKCEGSSERACVKGLG